MTYVTEQTSAELRAHMRRLQKMPGWHEPLADRLFKEIQDLDRQIAELKAHAAQTAGHDQENRIGTNTGHGHVWRRPDGYLARCGGPAICQVCARDHAQSHPTQHTDGGAVYE